MKPITWAALLLGGGAVILLATSSSAAAPACSPPPPNAPPQPALPGQYIAVGELWDDASCAQSGASEIFPVTASELSTIKSQVGLKKVTDIPPGETGFMWIFDEHGALAFAGKGKSGTPLVAI